MMGRYSGRIITKNPVVPNGPSPINAAPGIWTLPEVTYWNQQGRWPSASADPYWSYVSYLLGTTATNAAQNNTFLDSSTNNFTITRVGNTTQGSFTPYGTLWSNYFNASNVSVAYSTALDISSGDFTIEFWVNSPVQGGGVRGVAFFNGSPSFGSSIGWNFVFHTDGSIIFEFYNGNSAAVSLTTATTACNSSWSHIAVSRSGNTFRLYLNGALQGTGTYSGTCNTNSSWATYVGSVAATNTGNIASSYISNVRIVKGTAVYTSAFTPPAAPLTAVSGTSLLTCQSNRFRDASTNNFAITRNGDTRVSSFSPFVLAPPGYTTSVNGGSGYFDGSGDYLSIPNNTAFDFGSGDFTVEAWFYSPSTVSTTRQIAGSWDAAGTLSWYMFLAPTNKVGFGFTTTGTYSPALEVISTATLAVGAWNHLALVRNGSAFNLYLNGTSVASVTNSSAVYSYPQATKVGGNSNNQWFTGYISNLRIVKGTAVYTSAFTPPTTPLTAITNTSLLLNFTNAGIYDASMNNDMETVGNAQVSSAQAKYGTTSAYFDGSGDYLTTLAKPVFDFGTGDFTVEGWIYMASLSSVMTIVSNYLNSSTGWSLQYRNDIGGFRFGWGDPALLDYAVSVSTNTWYHIAVTRSGTTLRIFLNGTQGASTTNSTNLTGGNVLTVGALPTGGFIQNYNGYIDDLRITKGVARYTANFTPPAAALPVY